VLKNRKVALREKRKRRYLKDMALGLVEYLNAAEGAQSGQPRVLGLLKAVEKHREERKSERRRHQLLLEILDAFALYERKISVS
jgi:hypothetical protein